MAEPMDPNIEALDPSIRALRKAQARETLGTAGRILRGEPEPPRPDYTDQRIKLIGMLDNLRKLETELRAEKEKTGRVSLATEATLIKALAGLGEANIGAVSDVQAAKVNAYADRLGLVDKEISRAGIRRPDQLKEAAISSLNALGAYAKAGAVTPGQEPAFAAEVLKGLRTIDTTNPADAGLVSVYADELKNRYGVVLEDFIAAPGTSANVVPATITSIGTALQRGEQAQIGNAQYEAEMLREADKIRRETLGTMTVEPGSYLARALGQFQTAMGRGPVAETAAPPPPVTAPRAEKEAYLQTINPALKLDEKGENVVVTADAEGPTRSFSYEGLTRMGTPGAQSLVGVSMTDFLDQQEKYVLKELDRLENATDLDSVRFRKVILASPELATWAQQNGYGEFRPEQQFKALLDARRVETAEQNKAFRAKRDADILTREGAPIRQAGAAIRDFFRRPEEKVGPGARRSREDSADLTGGATTPAGKTDNTGATESDPTGAKGVASMARLGEGTAGIMPIDVEGAYREAETEAEAKAKKMAAESVARPDRTLPADTAFAGALTRGRNERTVQQTLNNADPTKFGDIAKQYETIQAFKSTDPRAYATALAGLAREVSRRQLPREPLIEGGGAETGTMGEGRIPIPGMGTAGFAMEEGPVLEEARRKYRETQGTSGRPQAIPQGRRGTLTGPSMADVAAINATLPPIDETDVPEPPTEGAIEEGTDALPASPPGTTLAEAEPDMTETLLQQKVSGAGTPAQAVPPMEEAQAAAAPKAGAPVTKAKPQSTLPFFESFGAEAATEAATTAMAQAQSAEEQARARRKALLMGTSMPA